MAAKMVTCPSSSVKVAVPSVPHNWLGVSTTMWPSCGLLGRASGCRLGDSNWFSRMTRSTRSFQTRTPLFMPQPRPDFPVTLPVKDALVENLANLRHQFLVGESFRTTLGRDPRVLLTPASG